MLLSRLPFVWKECSTRHHRKENYFIGWQLTLWNNGTVDLTVDLVIIHLLFDAKHSHCGQDVSGHFCSPLKRSENVGMDQNRTLRKLPNWPNQDSVKMRNLPKQYSWKTTELTKTGLLLRIIQRHFGYVYLMWHLFRKVPVFWWKRKLMELFQHSIWKLSHLWFLLHFHYILL